MATRSRIGLRLKEDSILSVYHHWDGYPQWLGVTLAADLRLLRVLVGFVEMSNLVEVTVVFAGISVT